MVYNSSYIEEKGDTFDLSACSILQLLKMLL